MLKTFRRLVYFHFINSKDIQRTLFSWESSMVLKFDIDSDEDNIERKPTINKRQLKRQQTVYKRNGLMGMGDKVQLEKALNSDGELIQCILLS